MRQQSLDTPLDIEEMQLESYRRMSPREKLHRIIELNRSVETMAAAGIRERHGPGLSERELRLRLGALRLPRRIMIEVFDWDPEIHGY